MVFTRLVDENLQEFPSDLKSHQRLNFCGKFHKPMRGECEVKKMNQHGIVVLNFDHTYMEQTFFQGEAYDWLDLDKIPGTNLYCEQASLRQIAHKLRPKRGKKITFIGSGNYHYVSFLLLSEIEKPFTLLLFDHHTDMLPSPGDSIISCGSWVLDSLQKIPMLQKVILIGVAKDWILQIPEMMREKIAVFSEPLLHVDYVSTVHSVIEQIPTEAVYISVDKDVLNMDEAATAWDQGSMQLRQLVEMVDEVAEKKEICGFDVCGEYPLTASELYLPATREAIIKNDHSNHVILEHVKHSVLKH